jgi:hypothetical protein
MWWRTPSDKGPCVTPGRPSGGANVVGGFDASAVPASPSAVSVGLALLLYCNSYCATRFTVRIAVRRGIFGTRETALSPNLGSRLGAEPSFNQLFITSVQDVLG